MKNISDHQPLKWMCIVCLLFNFHSANAESQDTTRYKIYLNGGVYFPESTTTLQINGKHGLGSVIYIEDLLHVDRHPVVFSANLLWKINKRSIVNVRYFHYNVKGEFGNS